MVDLEQVKLLVAAVNSGRWPMSTALADTAEDPKSAEQKLDVMFETSQTLAVYGTLAPGKPNHHIVAPYGGVWTEGVVEGDLSIVGWGSALGYPGFLPREGGSAVDESAEITSIM